LPAPIKILIPTARFRKHTEKMKMQMIHVQTWLMALCVTREAGGDKLRMGLVFWPGKSAS